MHSGQLKLLQLPPLITSANTKPLEYYSISEHDTHKILKYTFYKLNQISLIQFITSDYMVSYHLAKLDYELFEPSLEVDPSYYNYTLRLRKEKEALTHDSQ